MLEGKEMTQEAMKLALKRAFQLGQDYWYQADHDSYRENKKSDETLAKFRQLVDETCEALAEQPAQYSDIVSDGGLDPRNRFDQPAQQEPDWKAEYLKSVESGCITLDELREANAELNATNRQVEILNDALAESRRKIDAMVALARADEREACAKVCESRMTPGTGSVAILNGAAAEIRARGATHDQDN
jgi:hypothetical protein